MLLQAWYEYPVIHAAYKSSSEPSEDSLFCLVSTCVAENHIHHCVIPQSADKGTSYQYYRFLAIFPLFSGEIPQILGTDARAKSPIHDALFESAGMTEVEVEGEEKISKDSKPSGFRRELWKHLESVVSRLGKEKL
jgi:hypothetical protein